MKFSVKRLYVKHFPEKKIRRNISRFNSLLSFAASRGPFQIAVQASGNYDWQSKFPKIKANVERSKAMPGVKDYVDKSQTLKVDITFP